MKVGVGLVVLGGEMFLGLRRTRAILRQVAPRIQSRLYICIQPTLCKSSVDLFRYFAQFYSQACQLCAHLDVRILLEPAELGNPLMETRRGVEEVFVDSAAAAENWPGTPPSLLELKLCEEAAESPTSIFLSGDGFHPPESVSCEDGVVLGGTFDRLHNGHKLFLSLAALTARNQLTCGVTTENMHSGKILSELIEPVETRMLAVKEFLMDVSPSLSVKVVPIADSYGPSVVDWGLTAIIATSETEKGARKVIQKRTELGKNSLNMYIIGLAEESPETSGGADELKISSSKLRRRLLGSVLREPQKRDQGERRPYVVGLTGGSGSGKTRICSHLTALGVPVLNCDLIGHSVYRPGTPTHAKLLAKFGPEVLAADRTIDRAVLGRKVFADPWLLGELNGIVWPEIKAEVVLELGRMTGEELVIVDAAVLLEAGWEDVVDEVWVCFVAESVAVCRLQQRDGLTEEEAWGRLRSQISNKERIRRAHRVFCSFWEVAETNAQVETALHQVRQYAMNR